MTRHAAAYLRVSTKGQSDDDRFGFDVQAQAIASYAERTGMVISQTYRDVITGTTATRDGLRELIAQAAVYEAVIISGVDRLGRRVQTSYGVLGEMLDAGMRVHATDIGEISQDDDASATTFAFHAVMADADHRRIVKRLYNAKIQKVAGSPTRPGKPANPVVAYGWRGDVIDPTEAHWVRWMYRRLVQVGTQVMARELAEQGVKTRQGTAWTPTKLRRLLVNPLYRGVYEFGRKAGAIKARCEVEAIVSLELWASANEAMSVRRGSVETRNPARLHLFPLTGHIRCGGCGRAMNGIHSGRRQYGYYTCGSALQTKHNRSGQPCTHRKLYRADQLHATIMDALDAVQLDEALLLASVRMPSLPPPDLALPLADLARREDRLEAAYNAGAYTPAEFTERRRDLQRQREAVLATPAAATPLPPDLSRLRAALSLSRELPLEQFIDQIGLTVTVSPEADVQLRLSPPD
jgi:site-specific DNA recombinase